MFSIPLVREPVARCYWCSLVALPLGGALVPGTGFCLPRRTYEQSSEMKPIVESSGSELTTSGYYLMTKALR